MPIYEYICTDCGHELEALQKMSDEPLKFCPECGAGALKKKISASAFVLKGTGWYETDFKGGAKKDSKSEVKSDGDASSSKDSKTESKKSDKSSDTSSTKSSGGNKAA